MVSITSALASGPDVVVSGARDAGAIVQVTLPEWIRDGQRVPVFTPTDFRWGGVCNGNAANMEADTRALQAIAEHISATGKGYIYIPTGMVCILGRSATAAWPTAPMRIDCYGKANSEVGLFGGGKIILDDNFGWCAFNCTTVNVMDVEFDYLTDFMPEPYFGSSLGRNTGFAVYTQFATNVFYSGIKTNRTSSLAIATYYCDTAIVKHCEVAGSKRDGIHISNTRIVLLQENHSHDCYDDCIAVISGLHYEGVPDIVTEYLVAISNRAINGLAVSGMAFRGVQGGYAASNVITNMAGPGMLLEKWMGGPSAQTKNFAVFGNQLTNVALGYNLITGEAAGSDFDTIHAITVGYQCDNIDVHHNVINGSNNDGVYPFYNATNVKVRNNDFYNIIGNPVSPSVGLILNTGNTVDDYESSQLDTSEDVISPKSTVVPISPISIGGVSYPNSTLWDCALDMQDSTSEVINAWSKPAGVLQQASFSISVFTSRFSLPGVALRPVVSIPSLTGVQQGLISMPAVTLRPVVAAPSMIGVQRGLFTMPAVQVLPVIVAPPMTGVEIANSGLFILPGMTVNISVNPPSLAGVSSTGHSIRSPSGQPLDLRRTDRTPITINPL